MAAVVELVGISVAKRGIAHIHQHDLLKHIRTRNTRQTMTFGWKHDQNQQSNRYSEACKEKKCVVVGSRSLSVSGCGCGDGFKSVNLQTTPTWSHSHSAQRNISELHRDEYY
jgi:hypothetical protein